MSAPEICVWITLEESKFLKLATADLVLTAEVNSFGGLEERAAVNFVGGSGKEGEKTKQDGPAREFVVNDDGTVGCRHASHLVLGVKQVTE